MVQARICINGVGIREGGGWAVTRDLVTALALARPTWAFTLFLYPPHLTQVEELRMPANVDVRRVPVDNSTRGRRRWLAEGLPQLIAAEKLHACLDLTNMYSTHLPCPGIMLMHNMLVFNDFQANRKIVRSRFLHVDLFLKTALQRWVALRGIRKADYTIVQTEAVQRAILRHLKPGFDRLRVIPTGYTPAEKTGLPIRPSVKETMATPAPKITYISYPQHYKNYPNLLLAFAQLHARRPDVQLALSLDLIRKDDAYNWQQVVALRALAEELKLSSAVHFLGILNSAEVAYVLSHSTLMAYPSLIESFGLPLAEAMAAGCPVAAADLPYAHDVCGDAAAYFDPHRPEAIADVLAGLLNDPARLTQMKQAGLERAKRFSYEVIARQYVELFEKLLAR